MSDESAESAAKAYTMLPCRSGRHARVAVITIIEAEWDAAVAAFDLTNEVPPDACGFYLYRKEIAPDVYDMVLGRSLDAGNTSCQSAVKEVAELFRPEFIILCGIAGGPHGEHRWGPQLGDIVVADHVDGYEQQKRLKDKTVKLQKAVDQPSAFLRQSIVRRVRHRAQWNAKIIGERPDGDKKKAPRLLEGNIIAGEKLMADGTIGFQNEIFETYPNALAVDMESYGFARAAYEARATRHYNLHYLVVRAISDLVELDGASSDLAQPEPEEAPDENQKTRNRWRPYAAATAAAFTFDLVEHILAETGRDFATRTM